MYYRGHEISVVCEGKQLTEYLVETDEAAGRITCWISSEAGKEFSIHWNRIQASLSTVACYPNVDGVPVRGVHTRGSRGLTKFLGLPTSNTSFRTFQFTALETTDDDSYLHTANVQHIGEIKAEIWEVVTGAPTAGSFQTIPDAKVHERSKKAMAHRISYGKVQARPMTQPVRTKKIRRIAEYVFRYRSLAFLQAEGIAPPTAVSTTPCIGEKRQADDERPDEDDDDDSPSQAQDEAELKKLLAQVDTLQSKLSKNKPKNSGPNKRVKTEAQPVKFHGVIDLTED